MLYPAILLTPPLSPSHTLLPLAAVACVVAALRALLHAFMKSNQAGIRWKANYAGSEGALSGEASSAVAGEARDCVTCSRKPALAIVCAVNTRDAPRLRHNPLMMMATQLVAIVKGRDLQHLPNVAKLWFLVEGESFLGT